LYSSSCLFAISRIIAISKDSLNTSPFDYLCILTENNKNALNILALVVFLEKREMEIGRGKEITIVASDEITLIFKNVEEGDIINVEKLTEGPKSPERFEILQYYKIETKASFDRVEIRVIIPCEMKAGVRRLWQWLEKSEEWKDITTIFSSKYHLLIGETNHLSIFGIT
jgi:hypothetical protein